MIPRRAAVILLTLLLANLVAGCSLVQREPQSSGPIDAKSVLVLLRFRNELDVLNPESYRITHRINLGRYAIDYGLTPNGKVYLPLVEQPGDRKAYVGVLDRQTGLLSKIPSPVAGMDFAVPTADGTVFIRSGSARGEELFLLVMDSKTDSIIGTVPLLGNIRRPTPYTASSVLVPVSSPTGLGGNVYEVDRNLHVSKPLFPFDLVPFAPYSILLKPGSTLGYFLYNGFSPDDTGRRPELQHTLADPRLVESHIDVWDLKTHELVRRIFLPVPSAQEMTLGPDGRLFVGHIDMTHKQPVGRMTVVEPESGEVRVLETVDDPISVQIRGDRLYVSSHTSKSMDLFHLPDLVRLKRVGFAERPLVPPLSLPE